jgi:hypothetical protein
MRQHGAAAVMTVLAGLCASPRAEQIGAVSATVTVLAPAIAEAKVYKLLPGFDHRDAFEASGVQYRDGFFYVVFDNRYEIARIAAELPHNSKANTLEGASGSGSGFEGITWDSHGTENLYVVIETAPRHGAYYACIREYDIDLDYQGSEWTDHAFPWRQRNKGIEGIAWVRRHGEDYLLGLIESSGTVLVMQQHGEHWQTVARIPAPVDFGDYSDIAIGGNGRVAITSQEDARLWIGRLSDGDWAYTGPGEIYALPEGDRDGHVGNGGYRIYGNIEGVSWIGERRVVLVSDRGKASQPAYTRHKDQSIHIFDLP